ncbi:hypothetical protein [Microcystis phage Mel-JY01]
MNNLYGVSFPINFIDNIITNANVKVYVIPMGGQSEVITPNDPPVYKNIFIEKLAPYVMLATYNHLRDMVEYFNAGERDNDFRLTVSEVGSIIIFLRVYEHVIPVSKRIGKMYEDIIEKNSQSIISGIYTGSPRSSVTVAFHGTYKVFNKNMFVHSEKFGGEFTLDGISNNVYDAVEFLRKV